MSKSDNTKMVILVRRDLKMPPGKIAAQVAHACMKVFFSELQNTDTMDKQSDGTFKMREFSLPNLPHFENYIRGAFTKVVLGVDDEEQLLRLYELARGKGIHCSLIKDAGRTVFNGVATHTTAGIGPWDADAINEITGHLKLL